jgi:hypothetical protein
MARGRMIDRRVSMSKKIGAISDPAKVLWFIIYPHLDREGRIKFEDLEDFKDEIIPKFKSWNHKKIAKALNELADIGLMRLYPDGDDIAMEFNDFARFQIGLHKEREAESKISSPPKSTDDSGNYRINPENSSLSISISIRKEGIKKEEVENEFNDFWKAYPKHVAEEDALNAFIALRRKGITVEKIASAVNGYNAVIKRERIEPKYILYPASFLRKGKWKDFMGIVYKPPL